MVAPRSAQLLCPEAWQQDWHDSETVGPLDDGTVSWESRVVLVISYSPQEAEWTGAVGPCQLDNPSAVPWWLLRATLIVALTNVYYRSRDHLAPLPQPSAVLFAQHHCLILNPPIAVRSTHYRPPIAFTAVAGPVRHVGIGALGAQARRLETISALLKEKEF
jgi:hypothetical protein